MSAVYNVSMKIQNQIKRTLTQPEAIEEIKKILDNNDNINQTNLVDKVCDHFNFFNPQGNKQYSGCLKALRKLERAGHLVLPSPVFKRGPKKPLRLEEPVPEPQDVPADAGDINKLHLTIVETEEDSRTWNELMIQDHPRGAGPLVGRQLRYLVQSKHGYLGEIGRAHV